jgi:hypothetical protein
VKRFGKYRNIFFSEAIALIEPKLCINHWKVLYKLCVFYVSEEKIFLTLANQKKELILATMFVGQMERNGETL